MRKAMSEFRSGRRQAGINLGEMALVLAVVGALLGAGLALYNTVSASANRKAALEEMQVVIAAAREYRNAPARNGLYTGISVTVLNTQGYQDMFTTGTAQNFYGMNVTVAAAGTPSGADATLTYGFDSSGACQRMLQEFSGAQGVSGTPTCSAANVLTVTLQ